jgi:hypothetical protein
LAFNPSQLEKMRQTAKSRIDGEDVPMTQHNPSSEGPQNNSPGDFANPGAQIPANNFPGMKPVEPTQNNSPGDFAISGVKSPANNFPEVAGPPQNKPPGGFATPVVPKPVNRNPAPVPEVAEPSESQGTVLISMDPKNNVNFPNNPSEINNGQSPETKVFSGIPPTTYIHDTSGSDIEIRPFGGNGENPAIVDSTNLPVNNNMALTPSEIPAVPQSHGSQGTFGASTLHPHQDQDVAAGNSVDAAPAHIGQPALFDVGKSKLIQIAPRDS